MEHDCNEVRESTLASAPLHGQFSLNSFSLPFCSFVALQSLVSLLIVVLTL